MGTNSFVLYDAYVHPVDLLHPFYALHSVPGLHPVASPLNYIQTSGRHSRLT